MSDDGHADPVFAKPDFDNLDGFAKGFFAAIIGKAVPQLQGQVCEITWTPSTPSDDGARGDQMTEVLTPAHLDLSGHHRDGTWVFTRAGSDEEILIHPDDIDRIDPEPS